MFSTDYMLHAPQQSGCLPVCGVNEQMMKTNTVNEHMLHKNNVIEDLNIKTLIEHVIHTIQLLNT